MVNLRGKLKRSFRISYNSCAWLRNAVYSGSWVTDAKRFLVKQVVLRMLLEVIKKDERIKDYMAEHQHDANALALWQYFQSVITWVEGTFPKKRKEFMKGLDWGALYNEFKDSILDAKALEEEITRLIADDDVVNLFMSILG